MPVFLGVQFLATEYSTGKTHSGRIDFLGLDENTCPGIIEHKRHKNENVINQGLFYLDWLPDHKAEFQCPDMAQNDGFSRDVSGIGHWAAGDVELSIRTPTRCGKGQRTDINQLC